MTAQATPRRDSANLAANEASSSDSRSPSGTCPLMNAKVQLLPLRYGLTEGVDPSAELAMPFALKSRPLGLRLVRNGYLYVIDGGTGKLHEYRIDKGAIDKLLWQDAEVRADVRSRAVGEPQLVFPRTSILYVAYSELQWTARKCMQVLASPKDREHFMQAVDLRRADPQQGGAASADPTAGGNLAGRSGAEQGASRRAGPAALPAPPAAPGQSTRRPSGRTTRLRLGGSAAVPRYPARRVDCAGTPAVRA
ncbi:toxin VasX [Pseudomonas aeruginosa]|uniref:toxin VasX n=1 Tax=Pseudomonas aeruginosa TaxID=287 RepID=UPI002FDC01AB